MNVATVENNMKTNSEVKYSDMTETELRFIIDALKHRVGEAEYETKKLRGRLARFKVIEYAGGQHA